MSIESLKNAVPGYAKDLKLNLGSLARSTNLDEQRKWGTFLACAAATGPGPRVAGGPRGGGG